MLFQNDPVTGQRLEPIEEVVIDVDDEFTGSRHREALRAQGRADRHAARRAPARPRLVFHAPSRGLIGYQGEFLTDTRGTGVMNRVFHDYAPYKGAIAARRNGVLISNGDGKAVAYALWNLEDRGVMFVDPGEQVYQGMIIGENTRGNDLDVNPMKAKQLTNIRATGKDEAVRLTPPRAMTLEQAMAYIEDDELVEVTPKSIRLRKRHLDPNERKRASKQAEAAAAE